ncbi:hypothetical protein [Siphonobacter sp. SORGH_AS_1065]|uniref:hypothetical protein n=1 Tax=Siphonobacter sp. SORGH_AS_1065 TaxID=3041795 RepID=UPI00278284E6|nr:hypothetical protein [Siphonobacter sp. SORGH_AS_1065]MDQ1086990.1 hypothetical protein [Siphonobacter sp. SORGH_AS_1065]
MAKIQFIPRSNSFGYYSIPKQDDDNTSSNGWLFIIGFLLLLYGIWAYLKLSEPKEETPATKEPLLPTLPELASLIEIKSGNAEPPKPENESTSNATTKPSDENDTINN